LLVADTHSPTGCCLPPSEQERASLALVARSLDAAMIDETTTKAESSEQSERAAPLGTRTRCARKGLAIIVFWTSLALRSLSGTSLLNRL
jgi:hypothetical protein